MEFLHQKLLLARTKDQEDRIVNLMYAESKRHQIMRKTKDSHIKHKHSFIQDAL